MSTQQYPSCCFQQDNKHVDFFERAMDKIVSNFKKAASIYDEALALKRVQDWLRLLVKMDFDIDVMKAILKKAHAHIESITEVSAKFVDHFHPGTIMETAETTYEGHSATAYLNVYKDIYLQEVESYENYGLFKRKELLSATIDQLELNVSYNFVVLEDGLIYFSERQEYDSLKDSAFGGMKALLAPNHSLLADGKPVLTAGEFIIIGKPRFKVWLVGTTSGHYRPPLETKKYFLDQLVKMGVVKEQIVTTDFHLHGIPWKFVESLTKE
jgi:hypothetical protein